MGVFFGAIFFKKGAFCLLAPLKQMSFLITSNESTFFKNQGTRLGAIIVPNKGLDSPWYGMTVKHFPLIEY